MADRPDDACPCCHRRDCETPDECLNELEAERGWVCGVCGGAGDECVCMELNQQEQE